VLNKPYKDGHSIQNPYNLASTRTAVFVDGETNSPLTECTKWCVEAAFSLRDLVQFDRLHHRVAQPGDVWRVNFSRVQYQLRTVLDDVTQQLVYEKLPDTREDNIVWAPTGVVDIHRPEKWGFVLFASATDEHEGIQELNQAMERFLNEQIAMERVLDTVYYDQRAYFEAHECYAESVATLYGHQDAFPCLALLRAFNLEMPMIVRRPTGDKGKTTSSRRSYRPRLDSDEEGEAGDGSRVIVTPRAEEPLLEYTITIKSATQQWHMDHDARLWTPLAPQ
jgi:hypothetical protein